LVAFGAAVLALQAGSLVAQTLTIGAVGTSAGSQPTLGEILDRGGRRITADDFRRDLVGTSVSGLTATGHQIDLIYLDGGTVRGAGRVTIYQGAAGGGYAVEGAWTIDELDRVCVSMRYGNAVLPTRCQFWFKDDQAYFLSDSDSDRSARVLRRTVAR
jgi:hypothetical protein